MAYDFQLLTQNGLIIGIGNCGRSDDGIGWNMVDQIRAAGFAGPYEYRYQLNIEDAELISRFDTVLLIDACQDPLPSGFRLDKVVADATFTYTTHSIPPDTIAYLCQTIFGAIPDIYLLQIQGYNWEISEVLTDEALGNISRALADLKRGKIFSRH